MIQLLLTVSCSFISLRMDVEPVPHMLAQFDLVTHDLRRTRGFWGDAAHTPVTIHSMKDR